MRFNEYIESLPNTKTETIKKIAEITASSPNTVYRWLKTNEVPLIKQIVIAQYLDRDIKELFPY